jgi:hypothetical protein
MIFYANYFEIKIICKNFEANFQNALIKHLNCIL